MAEETTKKVGIVYNSCFGGFQISKQGIEKWKSLRKQHGQSVEDIDNPWENIEDLVKNSQEMCDKGSLANITKKNRTCGCLVALVENNSQEMSEPCLSSLKVEYVDQEIIDAHAWRIEEYDGAEAVIVDFEKLAMYQEQMKVKQELFRLLYQGTDDPKTQIEQLRQVFTVEFTQSVDKLMS